MAQMRKQQEEMRAAEEAEQRALEEEEQLRLKVLAELKASGTQFRSAPEDVLEYAALPITLARALGLRTPSRTPSPTARLLLSRSRAP